MRIGIYVDSENISRHGGKGIRYDILRDWASKDAEILRMNNYLAIDEHREGYEENYARASRQYREVLEEFGFKNHLKPIKWYHRDGVKSSKANSDLDIAVHMLEDSERLDKMLLLTGDGDFSVVIEALQRKGVFVEVMPFRSCSAKLRQSANLVTSGFLVPNLVPISLDPMWGQEGSWVRGVCNRYADSGIGSLRYIKDLTSPHYNISIPLEEDSGWASVFVHHSEIHKAGVNPRHLPDRNIVFEFQLLPSPVKEGELSAQNLKLVYTWRKDS